MTRSASTGGCGQIWRGGRSPDQHSAATRSVAASADGDPDKEMARNLQAWTANTFYSLLDI
jgi:hypothetical protein